MDKWIALVKANMKARKVTQNQLAARMGMSQGGIGHWLGKRRVPSLADMNRVLEELGLGYLRAALVIREKGHAPADDKVAPVVQYNPYFRYPVKTGNSPARSTNSVWPTDPRDFRQATTTPTARRSGSR